MNHSQKNEERIQKFKEKGDSRYIYKSELHKAYFQRDMGYKQFKHLAKRTASDKVLRDKAFNIAENPDCCYSSFKGNIWRTDLADIQLKANLMKELDFYRV